MERNGNQWTHHPDNSALHQLTGVRVVWCTEQAIHKALRPGGVHVLAWVLPADDPDVLLCRRPAACAARRTHFDVRPACRLPGSGRVRLTTDLHSDHWTSASDTAYAALSDGRQRALSCGGRAQFCCVLPGHPLSASPLASNPASRMTASVDNAAVRLPIWRRFMSRPSRLLPMTRSFTRLSICHFATLRSMRSTCVVHTQWAPNLLMQSCASSVGQHPGHRSVWNRMT